MKSSQILDGGIKGVDLRSHSFFIMSICYEMKILNEILRFDFFVVDGAKLLGVTIYILYPPSLWDGQKAANKSISTLLGRVVTSTW